METVKIKVAGNITYSGFTYNSPLFVEYKHTGKLWRYNKGKKQFYTSSEELAQKPINEGRKVIETSGYYFIERIAIPSRNADGSNEKWYITNDGDCYTVNRTSKYWKKIHEQLSKEETLKIYNPIQDKNKP